MFYLGNIFDPVQPAVTNKQLLYDSRDLTTHAVCLGMTGSGKTGLGIAILEEAALDKIPAIIVDPKGDLGNLLLNFPSLAAEEFQPWIDGSTAERRGIPLSTYAEEIAKKWKEGLTQWGATSERIRQLKDSVEMTIYTPGSQAGIPLSILSSFAAPTKEQALDTSAIRDRIMAVASGLLGLIGIAADPIKSREYIVISTIIDQAWGQGMNLDIPTLIQQIQRPPFRKIGALDLDTFYPPKERVALAISLNNLLASPGFQVWTEGPPLDIQQLLYTASGKPKLSILSIAHLSDSERMFFVTLLLNQMLIWMRRQSGTSSLRAILYMDEIFGYFPPTAMPPSKTPMLTLLKQARAFGLGIILATQNPVDLDYRGLSNCGTWFIGKLQTERDRARVIEGLNIASNGEITAPMLDRMMASTGNRVFIMRSIHQEDPILFQTRWTLSYFRGPLTLPQIKILTDQHAPQRAVEVPSTLPKSSEKGSPNKGTVPPSIHEFFVHQGAITALYRPFAAGIAKLHFVDSKLKIDTWREVCLLALPSTDGQEIDWDRGQNLPAIKVQFEKDPRPDSRFEELPAGLMQEKNYPGFEKALKASVYQNQFLSIYQYAELGQFSKEGESEGDFRVRIALLLRENRDEAVQSLRDQYGQKIEALKEKIRRAQEKMVEQKQQASLKKAETYLSMGAAVLGAIFGKKATQKTISKAESSMRRMGRASKESQEAARAEENVKALQNQLNDLQTELNDQIAKIPLTVDPSTLKIERVKLKPRKSDISIEEVALVWWATQAVPSGTTRA
jgi:hypothetical protein